VEWQNIAIALLTIVSSVGGWILRTLWEAVADMKKDLHQLENNIRTDFMRRDDVREMLNEIKASLLRVEIKLDGKADKQPIGPY
jgi:hypothetical protein